MLRISSPTDPRVQMIMRKTNTLTRQIWMLIIPKRNHNSTNQTHLPMHMSKLIHQRNHIRKQNRSDPQIITLNNHINKQIHEHKTNIRKQHLYKIDHKLNPHFLWGTIAKLSGKKLSTEQKHSLRN